MIASFYVPTATYLTGKWASIKSKNTVTSTQHLTFYTYRTTPHCLICFYLHFVRNLFLKLNSSKCSFKKKMTTKIIELERAKNKNPDSYAAISPQKKYWYRSEYDWQSRWLVWKGFKEKTDLFLSVLKYSISWYKRSETLQGKETEAVLYATIIYLLIHLTLVRL